MPTFSTSIQLYNADEKDLLLLDNELKRDFFTTEKGNAVQKVRSSIDNFIKVRYLKEGNLLIQEVIDRVWLAGRKTGKKFTFSVIKKRN